MILNVALITFTVTGAVLRISPWYDARYVLPFAGMVLGNSLNGIALALERFFADVRARESEVVVSLTLGATLWEACRPCARAAIRAGLIPTLNSMSAVGLVFIPGMMTGHVLAGTDPMVAAGYQIIVMFMLAAACATGCVVAVLLAFRLTFGRAGGDVLGALSRRAPGDV
jgi:putative ABC transport system permease protein